jgi:hypothetical protein
MFDHLVEVAKEVGNGDLLVGLFAIKVNRHKYDEDFLKTFDVFMDMGARMFEPAEAE